MDILCVDFRGSDDPVDSLFLLDQDWVDIGEHASRNVAKPQDPDENKIPGLISINYFLLYVFIWYLLNFISIEILYFLFSEVKYDSEFTE